MENMLLLYTVDNQVSVRIIILGAEEENNSAYINDHLLITLRAFNNVHRTELVARGIISLNCYWRLQQRTA